MKKLWSSVSTTFFFDIVHAIAQARRLRAVVEDMAQMCVAAHARNRDPVHEEAVVLGLHHVLLRYSSCNSAGPSASGRRRRHGPDVRRSARTKSRSGP